MTALYRTTSRLPRRISTPLAAVAALSLLPLLSATAATPEKDRSVATGTISSSPLLRKAPTNAANTAQVSCEPALTSEVAEVTFKSRASRITDKETVEALVRPLRQLAAAQGVALGGVEVLGWGANGADQPFPESRAITLMGEMTTSLQGAGFVCASPGTGATRQSGTTTITLLTAARSGNSARVMGFWIKTDHALLLAWGRVESSATGSLSASGVSPLPRPAQVYNPEML